MQGLGESNEPKAKPQRDSRILTRNGFGDLLLFCYHASRACVPNSAHEHATGSKK